MMWNQSLIWLHVITDALVALSYYSIPAALFMVVKKKPFSLPFKPLFVLFGMFIAFCGAGHAMDIVSIWKPIYWIKGFWNVGTALTSVVTAIVLIPKVADFIQIPESTARLQREKRLFEEKHGLLQSVLDSVSEGILLKGQDGAVLAYNKAALELLGASLQMEWEGKEPKDREIWERQDGRVIERSSKPIPGVGQLYVLCDVTEQRRANAALMDLQLAIATMRQGFATVSYETGKIELANASMGRVLGYTPEELTGFPAARLLAGTEQEQEQRMSEIREGAAREGFWEGEIHPVRKDDQLVYSWLRVNRHRSGERTFLSFIQTDITQQKTMLAEAEALQRKLLQAQKLESLGVLAGGVAHDFNNLLTGILGNASLAMESLSGLSPAREQIEQVVKAGERAADLTRQLLAYSGKGQFIVEPLDLSALAEETRQLVQLSVPKSVELKMNLKQGLPLVEADTAQMQQLLMNLVINGAEAVGDQPGTVQVTTGVQQLGQQDMLEEFSSNQLEPGLYVFVEVRDTGCGMSEETKRQIFDPFFTTKFTGRGLGLAAALGIVRGHGGTITVHSVPQVGSAFKVFLPVTKNQMHAGPGKVEGVELEGRGTVLVVDDEEVVRSTTKMALTHYGYDVQLAENGLHGVEKFQQSPELFSVVLLDLTMPVMGGEEALRRLRGIRPDVPVVLTSGFNEQEAVRQFEGKKLAGFLQKPFTVQQLAQAIRHAIGHEG